DEIARPPQLADVGDMEPLAAEDRLDLPFEPVAPVIGPGRHRAGAIGDRVDRCAGQFASRRAGDGFHRLSPSDPVPGRLAPGAGDGSGVWANARMAHPAWQAARHGMRAESVWCAAQICSTLIRPGVASTEPDPAGEYHDNGSETRRMTPPCDTITAALARAVAAAPHAPCLDSEGDQVTYAGLDALVLAYAHGLAGLGVRAGEPVA